MEKELNKRLKLDSIDWAEVIKALPKTEDFGEAEIKRALRKTNRSFNNNGPFHSTVKRFIETLGETVKTEFIRGEKRYTIISITDALKKVGYKEKTKTVGTLGPKMIELPEKKKPEVVEQTISEVDQIKGLFVTKKSIISRLSETLNLLAIYTKHSETQLSGDVIQAGMTKLGAHWDTFMKLGRPVTQKVLDILGYHLDIQKIYRGSTWTLVTNGDEIIDIYLKLQGIYKTLVGVEPKNLEDFIFTKEEEVHVKIRDIFKEAIKKQEEQKKIFKFVPREESNETRWKKWLLLEALRNRNGATSKISSLVGWISTSRHEDIDETEAKTYLLELQEDTDGVVNLRPGDMIAFSEGEKMKPVYQVYSPKKFSETIYVKLRLTPEEVNSAFKGLKFTVDSEISNENAYLYEVECDRSYSSEICMKDLLRFIKISGKLYSVDSWIAKRIMKIITHEDNLKKQQDGAIRILENF